LDLYRGQFDFFPQFSTQVHDFDPGINPYPDGLFWTVPIIAQEQVNLGTGTARMAVSNLNLFDYFNIPNAFRHTIAPLPATCSFDVRWTGPASNRSAITETPGSIGEIAETNATMSWSASRPDGFSFESDLTPTTSVFAQVGLVRNGIFAE
jgi:hypothetical protein